MVILLNGAASSGKTSVAELLQILLPEPCLCAGVDGFFRMLPPGFVDADPARRQRARQAFAWVSAAATDDAAIDREVEAVGNKWRSDMRRTIAFMASLGNNLIVDEILTEQAWVDDYRTLLAGYRVLWVGLHCPIEILEQRERERGPDRIVGQARGQVERVHTHACYDLELDTGALSPYECALKIAARLGED